jgi:Heavy metal associated domain 2
MGDRAGEEPKTAEQPVSSEDGAPAVDKRLEAQGQSDLGAAASQLASPHSQGKAKHGHRRGKPKHAARIEHNIPGRIRIKIPTAKGNHKAFDTYKAAISCLPGTKQVHAKPETGSIVIHYDSKSADFHEILHHCCASHDIAIHGERPGDEIDHLAKQIENEAEFLAQRSELAKMTVDFCKKLDRELKSASDNTIDLKIVLAGGLAAFTFLEIGAEAATPMWVTLALFSLNHFTELHGSSNPATAPNSQPPQRS